METYQDIKGWFDFEDVYDWVVDGDLNDSSHYVEVGSCFGRSTAYLSRKIIDSGKNIRLDAVDLWPSNFGTFFKNMVRCGVNHVIKPMRMPSHFAAMHYPDRSLDFVFIDAEHAYRDVRRDIDCWGPKIKTGGFLGGHDYHMNGVKKAVDETYKDVTIMGRSWMVRLF